MSEPERIKWAKGLLIKIHAITGWVIPQSELMNVLVDQFEKKLIESYPNANPDEVEYAFRNGGTEVKDWGKAMNLSLIDEVMIPYLRSRREVSELEERLKKPKLIEQPKEDLSEKAMSEWWKDVEKKVRNENYKMDFVPVALYEWLDKQGGINLSAKEKNEYLRRAANFRQATLIKKYEENVCEENKKLLSEFNKMKQENHLVGNEIERVKNIAKRMIVYDIMKK